MSSPSHHNIIDTSPLLPDSSRRQYLRDAARFMRRARMMREPSMLVRETAAEQLEERQGEWACSKPVVILDLMWNFALVALASAVLVLSWKEKPSVPLQFWIIVYVAQCLLHMLCVLVEYRKRRRRGVQNYGNPISSSTRDSGEYISLPNLQDEGNTSCAAKHLESANTLFSFIWWVIGFYWVCAGGQTLAHGCPQLYWLCIIFLSFDVFFVVFCVALACVIGIAVCCCLPCIIAILHAITDQEGASKEDIDQLLKFKFRRIGNNEKLSSEAQASSGRIMTECGTDSPIEHILSPEDAECCICITAYDDGVELRELPCGHHFHSVCVDKWLYINATCPLCKYNISKRSSHGREDV